MIAARVLVAAAVLGALAGCTTPPREAGRSPDVPLPLAHLVVGECVDTVGSSPTPGSWAVATDPEWDVWVVGDDGRPEMSPESRSWEAALEDCLRGYPVDWESAPLPWTRSRAMLQYLYYSGPFAACLREHGIDPPMPHSFGDFNRGAYPHDPYWTLDGDLEELLRLYADCPPVPAILMGSS